MNPPMGHPQQAHYMGGQPPPPPQHQNAGQQRQVPNGQQQFPAFSGANGQQQSPGPNQIKGFQAQQSIQSQFTGFDPQLAMFTFEKPRNSDSWANARPEQQPFSTEKIRKVLVEILDNQRDPTAALDRIPSSSCRKNIIELVKEQNAKLQEHNKKLQWTIAAVKIKSENDRGFMGMPTRPLLKRVKVILETGPSAFQVPQQSKLGGQANGMQDPNMPKQMNSMSQNPAFSGQQSMNGGQQPRPMPQQQAQPQHPGQPMQPGQFSEQQTARMTQHPGQIQGHAPGPNAPLPPPPPQPHPGRMDAPPPPPHIPHGPNMQHLNQPPPPPQHAQPPQQFARPPPQPTRPRNNGPVPGMPGAFPADGMRPSQVPFFEEDDPCVLRAQKVKRTGKGNQGSSSSSSSSSSTSSTDSDEWESDSANSSPDHVRVRNVEDDYGYVEGHKRGRSRKHKKSRKDKSHRKAKVHHQSRSRSRSRGKDSRKRRDSGLIDSPNVSRRNSFSSKESSPRLAHAQPNIHIHIDPNKVTEERRAGHNSSPTGHHKDRRRNEKINGAHAMSRENSLDGGSGTDSYAASSAHTGFSSVFDKPEHRPSVPQRRNNQKSYPYPQGGFNNPHTSNIYDDVDDRPSPRYPHADDYPYDSSTRRDTYFKEPANNVRPDLPHRRYTSNPFETTQFPPKPMRTSTFAAGMHEPSFPFHQKRQSSEREKHEDELRRDFAEFLHLKRETHDAQKRFNERENVHGRDFDAHEYAEFVDWKNNRSARRAPPLKRSSTARHDSGMYMNDDDFEQRYNAMRRGPYSSLDRI